MMACVVQNQLYGIDILFRNIQVISDGDFPRTVGGGVGAGAPDLRVGLVIYRGKGDVPLRAVPLRPLQPCGAVLTVPRHIVQNVPGVFPGDALKQSLLERRLTAGIDVGVVQERRPQRTAGRHGGHHHQQQKGRDLGGGALRQLRLPPGRLRARPSVLPHHRLGDLLLDVLFHISIDENRFHVPIPFSSLYP